MKAFEVKERTIQAQYELIMQGINNSIKKGLKTYKANQKFSKEVLARLTKEGFDVYIEIRFADIECNPVISWKNAKEGREGSIVYENPYVTSNASPNTSTQKKGFWNRVNTFLDSLSDDCW